MVRDLIVALRLAVRTLLKDRGFTIPALVALGMGMTLSTAALIVVNAYLVRTLPYPSAQRLYNVRYAAPGASQPRGMEALDWAALAVGALDADFTVVSPPALREHLRRWAERFVRAAG